MLENLRLQQAVLSPLDTGKLAVRNYLFLDRYEPGLLVQQLQQQVEGQVDAVVCPSVKAVVPPLDVVAPSNWQHVDGPAGRRSHCAGNPIVSYVLDTFPKSCGSGACNPIYRRKKDKKKLLSGLGLVRKVKNCDLQLLFLFVCEGY